MTLTRSWLTHCCLASHDDKWLQGVPNSGCRTCVSLHESDTSVHIVEVGTGEGLLHCRPSGQHDSWCSCGAADGSDQAADTAPSDTASNDIVWYGQKDNAWCMKQWQL